MGFCISSMPHLALFSSPIYSHHKTDRSIPHAEYAPTTPDPSTTEPPPWTGGLNALCAGRRLPGPFIASAWGASDGHSGRCHLANGVTPSAVSACRRRTRHHSLQSLTRPAVANAGFDRRDATVGFGQTIASGIQFCLERSSRFRVIGELLLDLPPSVEQ